MTRKLVQHIVEVRLVGAAEVNPQSSQSSGRQIIVPEVFSFSFSFLRSGLGKQLKNGNGCEELKF